MPAVSKMRMSTASMLLVGCGLGGAWSFVPTSMRGASLNAREPASAVRTGVEMGRAEGCPSLTAVVAAAGAVGAVVAARAGTVKRTTSHLRAAAEAAAVEAPPPPPFDPAKQIGAMAPLGFFDPLGFSKVGDEEGFRNLRAAELKHGRVAMLAAVGGVFQHFIKFPGFTSVPDGVQAVTAPAGTLGFMLLFLLSSALELGVWTQDPEKEVGDFGDPLRFGQYNDEMRAKELNNGRFAMFAALGIISADLLTGKDAIQQLGF